MIPIDQLITAPTADAIFDKLLTVLETVKVPARSWREGGVARTMLAVVAQVGAQGAALVTSLVRANFLEYAEGAFATARAKDVYDVDRIPATFATGVVTLVNEGGGIHSVGADELVVFSTSTGARFRVTQAFTLGALATLDVEVQAIEPGAASSAAPAEIDALETPLARVTVANAASIVGRNQERDADLKARARAKRGTWSPYGPRDAYEYAALTARLPGGTLTSITRVATSPASSTGTVTVTCATASGAPTSPEIEAVRDEVERIARPDTVTAIVQAATVVSPALKVIVWCRSTTAVQVVEAAARAAFAAFVADYPIGGISKTPGGQGYLYLDAATAAVVSSHPAIFDVDYAGDPGDVALAPNEVVVNVATFEVRVA